MDPCTLANYSIIKATVEEVERREAMGNKVTLTKVKSDTGAQDTNSLMNEEADRLAERGRTEREA